MATVETEVGKPGKGKRVPVASIHTHFNIFRNINEAHQGEVTVEEQILAVARHVRWHERQVEVGRVLLGQLEKARDAAASAF